MAKFYVTKKNCNLRKAIVELIQQYESRTHGASSITCPLCKIFFDEDQCGECPNNTFRKINNWGVACSERGRQFPKLKHTETGCDAFNAIFWKQVLPLFPDNNEKYILNQELKNSIRSIAETI